MLQAAGGEICDEQRCIDMTNFAPPTQNNTNHNSASSNGGPGAAGIPNKSTCPTTGGSNSSSSSSSSGDGAALTAGTILEVQGCFIKSEIGSIKSELGAMAGGTMRRLLECEHCHKFFTSRFNLQRHQLIHTGAKPYECPLCQQRFNQSGHVKTHLRTRHPNHDQILQEPLQLQQQDQQQQPDLQRNSNDHATMAQHQNEHSSSSSTQKEPPDDANDHIIHNNEHMNSHSSVQHTDHVIQRSEHL